MGRQYVKRVWVDDTHIYVATENGQTAGYEFSMWPSLANADPKDRQNFYLSYGGIHWPTLNEDLGFESMFSASGLCSVTPTEDSVCWRGPESSSAE